MSANPIQLYAPNGKRIVGTSETMLTMHGIVCTGRKPDGSLDFETTDHYKDYHDTEEQRRDRRGELLFQDEDGVDWPESCISVDGEPLKPMPVAEQSSAMFSPLPWRVVPTTLKGAGTKRRDIVSDGGVFAPALVASDVLECDAELIVRDRTLHDALVKVEEAAARVVGLYHADYLRGHADGGRVAHAMGQLEVFLRLAKEGC